MNNSQHGVPHGSWVQPATEQERRKEQQKIQDYKALVDSVNDRVGRSVRFPC